MSTISMNTEYQEFRTQYIKGTSYMLIFMAGVLTAFSLFIMWLLPNIWVIIVMLIPALLLPFVITLMKSHKVRFGEDYIETTYLLGTKRIDIVDVKKYGIFVSSRYEGVKPTSEYKMGEVNDDELIFHHIYLSTNKNFDLRNFKPKKHLKFRYRKNLYQLVKDKMEAVT